jgi:hypothetical protein
MTISPSLSVDCEAQHRAIEVLGL